MIECLPLILLKIALARVAIPLCRGEPLLLSRVRLRVGEEVLLFVLLSELLSIFGTLLFVLGSCVLFGILLFDWLLSILGTLLLVLGSCGLIGSLSGGLVVSSWLLLCISLGIYGR